jgi:hypothetical protein
MEMAEMLKILVPVSLLGLWALAPIAQAHAPHSNPDHYIYIPPRYDISCQEARVLLKKDGYRISKTIRCWGNYYQFRAQRSGRDMIVQVMTRCGKRMIDARSGSKGYRWRTASY